MECLELRTGGRGADRRARRSALQNCASTFPSSVSVVNGATAGTGGCQTAPAAENRSRRHGRKGGGLAGGGEVNIIRAGVNYGWPVITYGEEYSGGPMGEAVSRAGMAQPLHYWVPSIAPSGMAFCDGRAFPRWKGDLFVGALADQLLARLEI